MKFVLVKEWRDYNLKLKVIMLVDLTGLPSRVEGLNFHPFAADTAALLNRSDPDIARAETTSPFSFITISTETAPPCRALLAERGKVGCTFLKASPGTITLSLRGSAGRAGVGAAPVECSGTPAVIPPGVLPSAPARLSSAGEPRGGDKAGLRLGIGLQLCIEFRLRVTCISLVRP
jgi:hypothetical protein